MCAHIVPSYLLPLDKTTGWPRRRSKTSGVVSTRSRRTIVMIVQICTIRWTISGAVVTSLISEFWLLRLLLVRLKASNSLLPDAAIWRTTNCSIYSVVMKTMLFHEGYEPLEWVGCIIELVASRVKVELPLREHEAMNGIFDGCWSNKEFRATRVRKMNARRVDEP